MDDLEKFVDFLYEGLEGYVGTGCLTSGKMEEKFFQWPTERNELVQSIQLDKERGSVYIVPSLLQNKSRNKLSFKVSQVIWADFDGTNPTFPGDFPESHIVIQSSSSTKVHMYWRVPPITNLSQLENLNKRIAYGCNADIACWDATRFLRPPGTVNYKYEDRPQVRLVHLNSGRLDSYSLPIPDLPTLSSPVSVASLPSSQILLNGLSPKLKELFSPAQQKDRSDYLMRVGYTLAEEGYTLEQIVSLVTYLDLSVGKFKDRFDKLQRYIELAAVAVAKVVPAEKFKPTTLLTLLQSKEEIDWILNGWLHRNGLMLLSGTPGVGKTQLASQLSFSLTTGTSFLNREVLRPVSVMLLSLEMRLIELKYIFDHQVSGLTPQEIHKWSENLMLFDPVQESLETYGEIIRIYNPDVVIIDSVSELAAEDLKENEARKITRWWDKIRYDTDTALVVLHHDRKATDTNKAPKAIGDVYGSFLFTKTPETVITLHEDPKDQSISLIALKARMSKKDSTPVVRNDDTLLFSVKGPVGSDGKEDFTNAGGQFAGIAPDGSINLKF